MEDTTCDFDCEFRLYRYTPDGTLDSSFSEDGIVTAREFRRDSFLTALAIQPDGKILAAGATTRDLATPGGPEELRVDRYTRSGELDESFGGDGTVRTNFPTPKGVDAPEGVGAVALYPKGRIVVVGGAQMRPDKLWSKFAIARYHR